MFPRVHGAKLERRPLTFTDDFEGKYNLVLIAFKREQQFEIDIWIPAAKCLIHDHPDFRYYDRPTISRGVPLAGDWMTPGALVCCGSSHGRERVQVTPRPRRPRGRADTVS
jgi:hypothetical protein